MTVYLLSINPEAPNCSEKLDVENVAQFLAMLEAARSNVIWNDECLNWWCGALEGGEADDWPSRRQDMKLVSTFWPSFRFTLEGSDEAQAVYFREYYRDGQVHAITGEFVLLSVLKEDDFRTIKGKLRFAEFDPAQLVDIPSVALTREHDNLHYGNGGRPFFYWDLSNVLESVALGDVEAQERGVDQVTAYLQGLREADYSRLDSAIHRWMERHYSELTDQLGGFAEDLFTLVLRPLAYGEKMLVGYDDPLKTSSPPMEIPTLPPFLIDLPIPTL